MTTFVTWFIGLSPAWYIALSTLAVIRFTLTISLHYALTGLLNVDERLERNRRALETVDKRRRKRGEDLDTDEFVAVVQRENASLLTGCLYSGLRSAVIVALGLWVTVAVWWVLLDQIVTPEFLAHRNWWSAGGLLVFGHVSSVLVLDHDPEDFESIPGWALVCLHIGIILLFAIPYALAPAGLHLYWAVLTILENAYRYLNEAQAPNGLSPATLVSAVGARAST